MSQTAARGAIATALNTVDGINCSPWFRQTTKPGDAFVSYVRTFPADNGFGYIDAWEVLVIAPQTQSAAEKYLADNLSALISAAETELAGINVTPYQLSTDSGSVLGIVIQGNRAQD